MAGLRFDALRNAIITGLDISREWANRLVCPTTGIVQVGVGYIAGVVGKILRVATVTAGHDWKGTNALTGATTAIVG